jgi:hypothetical protein
MLTQGGSNISPIISLSIPGELDGNIGQYNYPTSINLKNQENRASLNYFL